MATTLNANIRVQNLKSMTDEALGTHVSISLTTFKIMLGGNRRMETPVVHNTG